MRRAVRKCAFRCRQILETLSPERERRAGVRPDPVDKPPVAVLLAHGPAAVRRRTLPELRGLASGLDIRHGHDSLGVGGARRPFGKLHAHAADARAQIEARPAGRHPRAHVLIPLRPLAHVEAVLLAVGDVPDAHISEIARRETALGVEVERLCGVRRTLHDESPFTAVVPFRELQEPTDLPDAPERGPVAHGRLHVVALLGVDRHGHRRLAAHLRAAPLLVLVVEEKRHQRLQRKRRVEDGPGEQEVLQHGIVVPQPREQLAPALRREYLANLLLAAGFDKAIPQDGAAHGRARLEVF